MADEVNDVEMSNKGQKVQAVTGVAAAAVGALLTKGVIAASVSNPILLGITVFSALLPSLFRKKQPVAARGLLGNVPADQVGGGGLVAVGSIVLQVAAILTALAAWLDQLHTFVPFIPARWQPYMALAAAGVAAITPGLQKLGELLKGGGGS